MILPNTICNSIGNSDFRCQDSRPPRPLRANRRLPLSANSGRQNTYPAAKAWADIHYLDSFTKPPKAMIAEPPSPAVIARDGVMPIPDIASASTNGASADRIKRAAIIFP